MFELLKHCELYPIHFHL